MRRVFRRKGETMAADYESKPIDVIGQTLTDAEYARAYSAAEGMLSPFRRRGIQAGICLSAAVLFASVIPLYRAKFTTFFGPICAIVLCVAFAALFYFYQPRETERWAAERFRSGALLSLPQKISVYGDRAVVETERERILSYWTEFAGCTETETAFVFVGGRERSLLILKKQGLSPERIRRLSEHFSAVFVRRYWKSGRREG